MTFEQLSAQQYAAHLSAHLMACERVPMHDAKCLIPPMRVIEAPASPVPEPGAALMLGVGLVVVWLVRRRT